MVDMDMVGGAAAHSRPAHHPSQGAPAVTLFTGALSLQCPPLSLQSHHPNVQYRACRTHVHMYTTM